MSTRCSLFSLPHLTPTSYEVTYYFNPHSKGEESETIVNCKGMEMWLPAAYSSLSATYVLFLTKQDPLCSLSSFTSALGHYLGFFSSSRKFPVTAFPSGLSVLSESQGRKYAEA